jgi:hypothetical protein
MNPIRFTTEDKCRFRAHTNASLRKDRPTTVMFRYDGLIVSGTVKARNANSISLGTRDRFVVSKIQSPIYDFFTGKEV